MTGWGRVLRGSGLRVGGAWLCALFLCGCSLTTESPAPETGAHCQLTKVGGEANPCRCSHRIEP